MSLAHRIGKDISAQAYWSARSEAYVGQISGPYHAHRLSVIKALMKDLDFQGATCLDVGCGDGVVLEFMSQRGGGYRV